MVKVSVINSLLFIVLISIILVLSKSSNESLKRSIEVKNECSHRIKLFWVNPDTKELVDQIDGKPLVGSASTSISSFIGHTFEAHEMSSIKNGVCKAGGEVCSIGRFTVNENYHQIIHIQNLGLGGFNIVHKDDKTTALEGASDVWLMCEEQTKSDILEGGDIAATAFDRLTSCVKSRVDKKLKEANDEIKYQEDIRFKMANAWENYNCADNDVETSEIVETKMWRYKGVQRNVEVMHDKPQSKIHVISDFISPEECQAMMEAAESQLSNTGEAKQAVIKVPWDKEKDNNPIATLSRRVYGYTNHATGLSLKKNGQENLTIQYFGRGESDTEADQNRPQCDGACTGQPYKSATKFAKLVMYCEVADKGGATNFKSAGVHIKPAKHTGLFFLYRGDDGFMDKGTTTYSGCPVISGEKKIVSLSIRLGVDE